jgi:cytochrome c biogenesis protein CcmG, thiol:disulfide interchange protein DsbE
MSADGGGAEQNAVPRTSPWLFRAPLIIFAGLSLLFLVRLFSGDPATLPSALIGRAAPSVDLAPLAGLTAQGQSVPGIIAKDYAGGRVTVVNIFASWCAPCREEHPLLMQLAARGEARIIGLNHKDNPENARRFLGALGNPYSAVGVDPHGKASIEWGVYGVPETFVVDGRGIVRHKHVGPLTPASLGVLLAAIAAANR